METFTEEFLIFYVIKCLEVSGLWHLFIHARTKSSMIPWALPSGLCVCAQSCPTLCHPMDCNPPGFSVKFSRWEYWTWLPFPNVGDIPNPRIRPVSLVSPILAVDSLPPYHLGSTPSRLPDGIFRFSLFVHILGVKKKKEMGNCTYHWAYPSILFPHGHFNPERGLGMWFIAGHVIVLGESGILLIKVERRLHIRYTIRDVCQRHWQ